jgi:hypothetical protein
VGGGVAAELSFVVPAGDNLPIDQGHGSDGNVAMG